MKVLVTFLFSLLILDAEAQPFDSYFTGNRQDKVTQASGGVCLMGGSTEQDNAMRWFLQRCNGGDVLILRASGSDGYNGYFFSELGVALNSVETIVFTQLSAANDPYIQQRIQQAEGIWFAGGNQWDYVRYWRDSPIDSLINAGINDRKIVIGGTSAGMAILGGYYFTAQLNTVTSEQSLGNPYHRSVQVSNEAFLQTPYLGEVITDTHYDNPDRKGRHMSFLARIFADYGVKARGIACDEFTAVCIDTTGIARVFGNAPRFDDNAYFLQHNCELTIEGPERCTQGQSLNWNRNGKAVSVYHVKGLPNGDHYFDLKDWKSGEGGTWQHWSVQNGSFSERGGVEPSCLLSTSVSSKHIHSFRIYPNPADAKRIVIERQHSGKSPIQLHLLSLEGKNLWTTSLSSLAKEEIQLPDLPSGLYLIQLKGEDIDAFQELQIP